ncbi:ribonuclease H-like domain-containing protein [Tanacetum coccineum]|uniref:Ribonuclease H-like domain-containing protein n=1 Tax=Tanacetum coccineum TaxID=301880 RepID=A0ABQ5FGP2_9ASTR
MGCQLSKEDINQKFHIRSTEECGYEKVLLAALLLTSLETWHFNPTENITQANEVTGCLLRPVRFEPTKPVPQLKNEDFQQIDEDDLEEFDLRWQVAMLTVKVRKFIHKTIRNMDFKEKQPVSLDKSKIECYNCHRKGHFTRECRSGWNQGKRSYKTIWHQQCTTNESSSQALVLKKSSGGL